MFDSFDNIANENFNFIHIPHIILYEQYNMQDWLSRKCNNCKINKLPSKGQNEGHSHDPQLNSLWTIGL